MAGDAADSEGVSWGSLIVLALVIGGATLAGIAAANYLSNSVEQTGTVYYSAGNGPNVTVDAATTLDINATTLFPNSQTVALRTSAGNATFTSTGATKARVDADTLDGAWTNLSQLDVTTANLTVDAEGMQPFTVGGNPDSISVADSFALDDGTADFVYQGSSGTTLIRLRGLPADTPVVAVDQNNNIVGGARVNASGYLLLDSLQNSKHVITLQTSSDGTPQLSDLAPVGGQSQNPSQFEAQVNDSEFPQGDDVTVEIKLEGSTVSTQTITSNQTVTAAIPASGLTGGTHNWTVTATDNSGETAKATAQYKIADALFVRPIEDPDTTLTNVDVNVTFFGSDTVVSKNTGTNGYVNLTGLPVNEKMLVEADPPNTSDYGQRSMVLDSIFTQESMYLLNTSSTTTVEVRFTLDDQTGNFPVSDTELIIERPLNISGTLQYARVDGGEMSVAGVTTDLEENERYRLTVRNDDGDARTLGTYKADVSETVQLTVGTISAAPSAGGKQPIRYNASYLVNDTGRDEVQFTYRDDTNETTELYVTMYEYQNQSNVLFANKTYLGPLGTVQVSQDVPQQYNSTSWVVKFNYVRNGTANSIRTVVGPRKPLLTGMPTWLKTLLSIGLLWVVAGLFSQLNGAIGAIVVSALGGMFWFVGFLPPGVGLGVVMLALITSAVILLRERAGASAP